MNARNEILTRVRSALHVSNEDLDVSRQLIRRSYNQAGKLTTAACLDLFIDRLLDYDVEVLQAQGEDGPSGTIAQALRSADDRKAIVASSFPADWLAPEVAFERDDDRSALEIEEISSVVTTCEAAVASTGTIIMVHHEAQARRILTLLPDHHICLVRRNQVVELLPEAFEMIASYAKYPITTISGPSATSDIEMTRVGGVHGPRRLTVILHGIPASKD